METYTLNITEKSQFRLTQAFWVPTSSGPHRGTDYNIDMYPGWTGKSPLLLPEDALVTMAQNGGAGDLWTYGNFVQVRFADGYELLLAHMRSLNVKPGQALKRGAVLGIQGSTGNSSADHVHIEYKKPGRDFWDRSRLLPCHTRIGGPAVPGRYANNYKVQQEDTEMTKLKIYPPLDKVVSSAMVDQGLVGVMGADGKLRAYDLKGDARMARAYTPETLSPTFEDMRDQMLPGEAMFAVDD